MLLPKSHLDSIEQSGFCLPTLASTLFLLAFAAQQPILLSHYITHNHFGWQQIRTHYAATSMLSQNPFFDRIVFAEFTDLYVEYRDRLFPINTNQLSKQLCHKGKRGFHMMGGQGGDATMVTSSIALLQERFRQLQKVREKREEKELLKLFSEADRAESIKRYEPEVALLSRRPQQDSLALGLNSLSRQTDFRGMVIPASTSLWPNSAATSSTSGYYEHSDVDTSLHL